MTPRPGDIVGYLVVYGERAEHASLFLERERAELAATRLANGTAYPLTVIDDKTTPLMSNAAAD